LYDMRDNKIRVTVKWNTGTRVHKPQKGKGSYKRITQIKAE